MRNIGLGGVLLRFVCALGLVVATYNPSGRSYLHWVAGRFPQLEPFQAVAGIALLGLWIFVVHATWRSLGTVGVGIGVAFLAALIWLFSSFGWFSLTNPNAMAWAAIGVLACLLTAGLCWAIFQRRITGQAIVEDDRR